MLRKNSAATILILVAFRIPASADNAKMVGIKTYTVAPIGKSSTKMGVKTYGRWFAKNFNCDCGPNSISFRRFTLIDGHAIPWVLITVWPAEEHALRTIIEDDRIAPMVEVRQTGDSSLIIFHVSPRDYKAAQAILPKP